MKLITISLCFLLAELLCPGARGANTLTTLYSFTGLEDGANPVGLLQGRDGNFYGTTSANSIATTNGPYGTVFRITPDGAFTNLHVFSGTDDGAWPQAGLAQDTAENLYGSTFRRGANGWGTVFKITPSGNFTTLVACDGFSTGNASSLLVPASDGNLYSLGNLGGTWSLGTLFRVVPDGTAAALVSFDGLNGFAGWGWNPNPLLQDADTNFYGATRWGGPAFTGIYMNSGYGTLFKMTPDGTRNNLFEFNGTNGYDPNILVRDADGVLYGTTSSGGPGFIDNPQWGGSGGSGTVFKLTTDGVLKTLAVFDRTNGHSPNALMLAGNGNFYGTTSGGGTNGGFGTIFQMTTNGALTSLFSFNGTNGGGPSSLVEGQNGNFYGKTSYGGASTKGTIFRFSIAPALPVIDNVSKTGGLVTFSWAAHAGRSYQIQFKGDLTQTNWTDAGDPVTATNTSATASDTIGPDRQRFYRVALLP